jgi:tRNA pseudouridine38-40 synthase
VEDAVRNLSRLLIINEPPLVIFEVTSNGFLKQMVRNIVGTLVDVSSGRFEPDWMVKVLREKDRKFAGQCAPAEGLYLLRVDY